MIKINAESLQSVHLKKTELSTEQEVNSKPVITGQHHIDYSEEQEQATREYFFSAGIDEWYNSLQDCTFPSAFTEITVEECREIIHCYQEQLKNPFPAYDPTSFSAKLQSEQELAERLVSQSKIPTSLQDLVKRIQQVMTQSFPNAEKYFVKLSTRSPKDSKILFEKATHAFKQRIDACHVSLQKSDNVAALSISENDRWIMLTEEVAKASSVNNAIEALELFLDSERVYEDLLYALEEVEAREKQKTETDSQTTRAWSMSIVIRTWDPRVTLASEFRGFCWNYRLTCLGQYYHPLYFPWLETHRDEIVEDCLRLFNSKVKESLPVPNALVDFAWLGDGEVMLIEVNPLSDCLGSFSASTGLFDYEADRDLIQGKDPHTPCILRLRDGPEDTMKLKIKSRPEWRNLVYGYRPFVK
jgi:hypothetical protein